MRTRRSLGAEVRFICLHQRWANANFGAPLNKQRLRAEIKVHPPTVAFLCFQPPPHAPLPVSASHTTYPATFGTSFSLLGVSRLGHWHKINEDTKKAQGSELDGACGWGAKALGCKIALAAALLFQHFMVRPPLAFSVTPSASTYHLQCIAFSFLFFFFCILRAISPLEFGPLAFVEAASPQSLSCLVFMIVQLCFLDRSCRVIRGVHFGSLEGREQKVQQANIRTLIRP